MYIINTVLTLRAMKIAGMVQARPIHQPKKNTQKVADIARTRP